MMVQLSTPIWT